MVDLPLPDAPPDALAGAAPAAQSGELALRRVVERVRAWQHRHPLARRIGPQDVVGVGLIALPYGPPVEGAAPQPLYHQPRLLPGLSHRALVEFAVRHAVPELPGPPDWPRRDIERADASTEPAPGTRYLLTAAVSAAGTQAASPRRLLLAPAGPAVWGRREWSRPRVVAAVAGGLVLAAAMLAAGWSRWPAPAAVPEPAAPASAVAASAVASAPALPVSPAAVSAAVPPASASVAAASTPMQISASAAHAASSASAALPAPPVLPMPQRAAAASAPASASIDTVSAGPSRAVPAGPHYALVSAPAKKRLEAEATLQRVQQLLGPAIGSLQAQIMPSPEGYVVTIWPLPTQADAEHLAEVLARRGVPMKWMEF